MHKRSHSIIITVRSIFAYSYERSLSPHPFKLTWRAIVLPRRFANAPYSPETSDRTLSSSLCDSLWDSYSSLRQPLRGTRTLRAKRSYAEGFTLHAFVSPRDAQTLTSKGAMPASYTWNTAAPPLHSNNDSANPGK